MYAGRITQSLIFDKIKTDLDRSLRNVQNAQNVVSTGKRVNRPSDDPIAIAQIMKRKVDINQTDRYIKNTENAKELLTQASSTLVDVTAQLDRARKIALTFANDPTSVTGDSAKIEVENILQRVINLANSKENGRYIFAGTKTHTQPFEANDDETVITYNGNEGEIKRQISPNATMTVNVAGSAIFSDGGVFQSLIDLRNALDEGNSDDIRNSISGLDGALDKVSFFQADLGSKISRLDDNKKTLDDVKLNITKFLSKEEDADMASAITEFMAKQTAYKAALNAATQMMQPSLIESL